MVLGQVAGEMGKRMLQLETRQEGTFRGNGRVLCLDSGGGYMRVDVCKFVSACQNLVNWTPEGCAFCFVYVVPEQKKKVRFGEAKTFASSGAANPGQSRRLTRADACQRGARFSCIVLPAQKEGRGEREGGSLVPEGRAGVTGVTFLSGARGS